MASEQGSEFSYIKSKSGGTNMAWMLTFADLISLVLTFFVLIYAMSAIEQKQWYLVKQSFAKRLNPSNALERVQSSADEVVTLLDTRQAIDLDYLSNVIAEKISHFPELKDVQLRRLDDRLVISLTDDTLFEPGSSSLTPKAISVMFFLEGVLYSLGNAIEVNGHSDPTPIQQAGVSNWELSLARATTVAEELKKSGYQYTIRSFGFADSRYDDLEASQQTVDKTRLHRLSRRVDIIIRAERAGDV